MEKTDIYKKMLETFSNHTKMKIIMLLAENGEMTVTQMAPHLDLGRSNLYHFVRQMVNDGMLKNPP
jgi:predicted transcriptional regulator